MQPVKTDKREEGSWLDYWRDRIARYITEKREASGKGQKEVGVSRQAVSEIERAEGNPSMDTLLTILENIGGDISEMFESRTPKKYDNPAHRLIHEQLQELLEASGDWPTVARVNVDSVYKNYLAQKRR